MFCSAVTHIFTSTRNSSCNKLKKHSAVVHNSGARPPETACRLYTPWEGGLAMASYLTLCICFCNLQREDSNSATSWGHREDCVGWFIVPLHEVSP